MAADDKYYKDADVDDDMMIIIIIISNICIIKGYDWISQQYFGLQILVRQILGWQDVY